MTSISERVALGAKWLDEERPGWERKVDVHSLTMSHGCFCVLGQLFEDFDYRPDFLRPLDVARDYGFECSRDRGVAEYPELSAEWRRVITSRREATGDAS